ncbi:MAG: hypothetical protein M1814_000376 [Vezdaea aestivalis]|nr:MAG: hypothetical protein M1814_000376 [Vezdaea aestivalis]
MSPTSRATSPPAITSKIATLTFPSPQILVITLSRPKSLNSVPHAGHWDLHRLYTWYDSEPTLRCAILTGAGRVFSAGADLKEWLALSRSGERHSLPPSGFGGLSRRTGLKPVICAVNGLCLGGAFEMVLNADLVIAIESATFGLPEVKRGVAAIAGALPRLPRVVGRQRAMEMALTGRMVPAMEMKEWGVVNVVVPEGNDLLARAIALAEEISGNSPDGIVVSKAGIEKGWSRGGVEEGSNVLLAELGEWLESGENIKEGLKAFIEKRAPVWQNLRGILDKAKL